MPRNTKDTGGPIPIEYPPGDELAANTVAQLRLVERLRGDTTSLRWPPTGLSPEIDELGERLHGHRQQILDQQAERQRLRAMFRQETEELKEAVTAAFKANAGKPPEDADSIPEDTRTSEDEKKTLIDNTWGHQMIAQALMADVADEIVAMLREQGEALVAAEKAKVVHAEDDLREIMAAVQAKRNEIYKAHKRAGWIKGEAADQGFARQPAPEDAIEPRTWKPDPMVFRWAFNDDPEWLYGSKSPIQPVEDEIEVLGLDGGPLDTAEEAA